MASPCCSEHLLPSKASLPSAVEASGRARRRAGETNKCFSASINLPFRGFCTGIVGKAPYFFVDNFLMPARFIMLSNACPTTFMNPWT